MQDGIKATNIVLRNLLRRLTQHSLLSKCPKVLRYKRVCNFIYAHKISTAFALSIFTIFWNFQQHYLQIFSSITCKSLTQMIVQLSPHRLQRNYESQPHFTDKSCTQFYSHVKRQHVIGQDLWTSLSEVQILPHRFTHSPQILRRLQVPVPCWIVPTSVKKRWKQEQKLICSLKQNTTINGPIVTKNTDKRFVKEVW